KRARINRVPTRSLKGECVLHFSDCARLFRSQSACTMPLKLLFRFVVLLGLTVPAFAAKTEIPPAVAALPPTKAKAGYVQGRVTDSAGKPLAGVMIHIYGTTFAGENTRFERPTGADGRFSQRLP